MSFSTKFKFELGVCHNPTKDILQFTVFFDHPVAAGREGQGPWGGGREGQGQGPWGRGREG